MKPYFVIVTVLFILLGNSGCQVTKKKLDDENQSETKELYHANQCKEEIVQACKNNNYQFSSKKPFTGGEISTVDRFLYGKIEARVKLPNQSGVISSLFLIEPLNPSKKVDTTEEIDFEYLGACPEIIQTNIRIPGHRDNFNNPNQEELVLFASEGETKAKVLSIEWTPFRILWLVDGQVVRQHDLNDSSFDREKRISLNLWASAACEWAGKLPLSNWQDTEAEVEYIRFYSYLPAEKKFSEEPTWVEDFQEFPGKRWRLANHTFEDLNVTYFKPENVQVVQRGEAKHLVLKLKKVE